MGDLNLTGQLNLMGSLELKPSGKLTINHVEALVEGAEGNGVPVMLPPPPAGPSDAGPKVVVKKSFNATVKVNGKLLVTQGVTVQGSSGTWPGMVQASTINAMVTAGGIHINVVGDQAITLPTGTPGFLTPTSGQ